MRSKFILRSSGVRGNFFYKFHSFIIRFTLRQFIFQSFTKYAYGLHDAG